VKSLINPQLRQKQIPFNESFRTFNFVKSNIVVQLWVVVNIMVGIGLFWLLRASKTKNGGIDSCEFGWGALCRKDYFFGVKKFDMNGKELGATIKDLHGGKLVGYNFNKGITKPYNIHLKTFH